MNEVFIPLIEAGVAVLAVAMFLCLTLACEVGFRVGRWRDKTKKLGNAEADLMGALTGGMLALLAFMLGLTINFAQNRFEARRDLVAEEANSISTAWRRASLVGGPDGKAIAVLIESYAKTRLDFTEAGLRGPIRVLIARTAREQEEIWGLVTEVANKAPTPITAALVTSLNQMFDASLSQRFAFDGQVPNDMLTMLFFGALIAIGAMGFQMGMAGARQPVLSSLLLIMWTGGMVMTVDINRPRLGNIRVDTKPLQWVIKEISEAHRTPATAVAP